MIYLVTFLAPHEMRDSRADRRADEAWVELGPGTYRMAQVPNPVHPGRGDWLVLADRPSIGASMSAIAVWADASEVVADAIGADLPSEG